MLFVIHAVDKKDALPRRLEAYEAHKRFLSDVSSFGASIVTSGPLVSDDGSTMIGSLFIVDAPDRQSVERLNAADPFCAAGVWEQVSINAFLRRQG